MAVLSVHGLGGEHRIPFTSGLSLLELLRGANVRVRSGCGAGGACGLCRVRIEDGAVDEPTAIERFRLTPDQLAQGVRLACQVRPRHDLCIALDQPTVTAWRSLDEMQEAVCAPVLEPSHPIPPRDGGKGILGVAVDLGTTQIKLTLWDKSTAKRLAGRSGLNPQETYGADVMTRLVAASDTAENAHRIAELAQAAVGEALQDMVSGEGYQAGDIGEVVIVGNTAMLALFAEKNYQQLLRPEYWSRRIDCGSGAPQACVESWGLAADARVEVVPPLAGFVGSDILAGIVATNLTEQAAGSLLVDFGTNSEIALWDGDTLWVTSAAGGPAFEGSGIRFGMPAEAGAICRVEPRGAAPGIHCEVIGGGVARGLCGSGLVDLIALIVKRDILSIIGKLKPSGHGKELVVSEEWPELLLGERDIDLFQRAKGAIGAGIGCLMTRAGLPPEELRYVYVGGAFGRYLNIENAQNIGLLPDIAPEQVILCGNTALAGCERLLLSGERTRLLARLEDASRTLNLAEAPDFERLFVENLYLRPMRLP